MADIVTIEVEETVEMVTLQLDEAVVKAVWGTVDGDLSNQADVVAEFATKVDNSQVQTDVPVGAVFTDTRDTPAEVKTKYESNANTNAFTDAEETKLGNIEAEANKYVKPLSEEIAYINGLQGELDGKEDALGNPSTNGHILSSTIEGIRSWIPNAGVGGSGVWGFITGVIDDQLDLIAKFATKLSLTGTTSPLDMNNQNITEVNTVTASTITVNASNSPAEWKKAVEIMAGAMVEGDKVQFTLGKNAATAKAFEFTFWYESGTTPTVDNFVSLGLYGSRAFDIYYSKMAIQKRLEVGDETDHLNNDVINIKKLKPNVNTRTSHPANYKQVYQDTDTKEYYTLAW